MSIISLIFGIIGLIACFMALSSFRLLAAFGLSGGMTTISFIVSLLGAIFMLIAGIYGIANSRRPERAGGAIVLGVIMIIIQVISIIITIRLNAWMQSLVGTSTGVSYSWFTGFIIPVLYIIAAVMLKGNKNNSYAQ